MGQAWGSGLALARLRREDSDFLRALFADPGVSEWFVDPTAFQTARGARAYCSAAPSLTREHRFVARCGVAAHRRGETRALGFGFVRDRVAEEGFATIGFALERAAWGRGRGTALAGFLCSFAFDRLEASEIRASVKPANRASRRVLEKNGFRPMGVEARRGAGGEQVLVENHALLCASASRARA